MNSFALNIAIYSLRINIIGYSSNNESDRFASYWIRIRKMGRWQSGQLHQTVNLTPHGYIGSNPILPKLKDMGS